jgi:hypothetical protein
MTQETGNIPYGKVIYIALEAETSASSGKYALVTGSDSVAKLKVSAKWTVGGSSVKSVEIVKKTVQAYEITTANSDSSYVVGQLYGFATSDELETTTKVVATSGTATLTKTSAYFVAITTTGSSLDETEVAGTVTLKGKSGTKSVTVDKSFDIDFTLAYASATATQDSVDVATTKKVYDFSDNTEDEVTLTYGSDVEVVINGKSEKTVLLGYNTDDVDEVVEAYDNANLDFYALTGTFKKTAEVTIYADEDTYLYEVVDGKVKAVKAEYDEYTGAFVFNARTLGTYVVSDIELKAAADDTVETVVSGTSTSANPSTGAAA